MAQVTDGVSCDAGAVCSKGACVGCSVGADCSDAGACKNMTIACASGTPACMSAGNAADGTSCGANLYCNGGMCAPCSSGASCVPSGKACHQGTVSCVNGGIICTDTMANASDGTSCGTNQVCNAGQCVACVAGASCNPGGDVCKTGTTTCASGQSVCMASGNATSGTPCDDGNACTSNDRCSGGMCMPGVQKTCSARDPCHQAGTCDPKSGACSNPVQPTGHACDDGNACTNNDQCSASGVCSGTQTSCPASDSCHMAGTCSGGACSNPKQPDGTSCGSGMTCQNGVCSGGGGGTCGTGETCAGRACPVLPCPYYGTYCNSADNHCAGSWGGHSVGTGANPSVNNTTLYAVQITIQQNVTVFGFELRTGTVSSGNGILGLYSDSGGSPSTALPYSVSTPLIMGGWASTGITPTPLGAGTYWVALSANFSAGNTMGLSTNIPCVAAPYTYDGQLPASWPAGGASFSPIAIEVIAGGI